MRPWTRTSDSHKQVCTEVRSSQRSGRQPAAEGLPSKSQVSSELCFAKCSKILLLPGAWRALKGGSENQVGLQGLG